MPHHHISHNHQRRAFVRYATASVAGVSMATSMPAIAENAAKAQPATSEADRRKFMEEACRLATDSVEKGWGGPCGAVVVKDGEIIGRGQNRVLLTGVPVYHAEVTAIIDASQRLNPKALLGAGTEDGTILQRIPRPPGSPDLVEQRAKMLAGCEIYVNAAPCPMCMSAIYWARIDQLFFAASLEDTSSIGFSDAFQYEDFALPWEQRKGIKATPNFERELGLEAYRAWMAQSDPHYY